MKIIQNKSVRVCPSASLFGLSLRTQRQGFPDATPFAPGVLITISSAPLARLSSHYKWVSGSAVDYQTEEGEERRWRGKSDKQSEEERGNV